jgi:hypothetical protein
LYTPDWSVIFLSRPFFLFLPFFALLSPLFGVLQSATSESSQLISDQKQECVLINIKLKAFYENKKETIIIVLPCVSLPVFCARPNKPA